MKHHGLVPERRTNKNGVTTTRWVRSAPSSKTTNASSFPPPPKVTSGNGLKGNGKERLLDMIVPSGPQDDPKRKKSLENIEFLFVEVPDLLERIAGACDGGGAEREEWLRLLWNVDYAAVEQIDPGITRRGIERALVVFPYIGRLCGSGMDVWTRTEYMDGYYDLATFLTEESGRSEVSENETRAMVLACYIRGITPNMSWEQRGMDTLYADMKDDLEYLASHLDEVEPFLDELLTRKDFSKDYIETVLTSDARSLTSGIL